MHSVNVWLSRYAKLIVATTFCLIFLGGMVTSLDAGLSVPDWPTSFGYNMFTFPISRWKGLVFWEHTHRLVASVLGMLIIALTIWVFKADRRSSVRKLSVAALILVIIQGLMGGFRVTEISTTLAIIHGVTAQAFFCLLILLAATLSPAWSKPLEGSSTQARVFGWRRWGWVLVISLFIQLILGAMMRHWHAGLAIPTFPLTPQGTFFPVAHDKMVDIHFSHRFWAIIVTVIAAVTCVKALRSSGGEERIQLPAVAILFLILVQILLGASVIWLGRAPIPTSLHVVNGALILGFSFYLAVQSLRLGTLREEATCHCADHEESPTA